MNPGRLQIIVLCVVGAVSANYYISREEILFPELAGPVESTQLPVSKPNLSTASFTSGDDNALALLVNDPGSSWFGVASGLKRIGIPFKIVASAVDAIEHDVIMVYPALNGANTSPSDLQLLAGHVRDGGTLIAFSVIGGGMPELFGFTESVETALLREIRFADNPFTNDFAKSMAESVIRLGRTSQESTGLSGIRYLQPKHSPIASFSDGSAAITYNFFSTPNGTGHAYAIGLDLGHFILRANNGRFNYLADTYVNGYQPKVDTFLRFLRAVYLQGEDKPVLLSPAPEGKDLTVLVTHDIDFPASLDNTIAYASYESSVDIRATYFIQTKYITDFSDSYFFTPERVPILKSLMADGMEIASHSVSHSNEFKNMPAGTGLELYPAYRPFVQSFTDVRDASILGELRVSKFLLEQATGQSIQSFRPGHLSLPPSLPQMLESTGYRFSSSITANQALSHLPYLTMYDRAYEQSTNIYEFPVTIEDEAGDFNDRLEDAVNVARNISRYRGLVSLLIHTETVEPKLDFIRQFVAIFRDTAWFGTMSEFGRWWQARNQVFFSIEDYSASEKRIHISAPEQIDGLTLELPSGWTYLTGVSGSSQSDNLLALGSFFGEATVRLAAQ